MERLAQVQRVFREVFDDDALLITPETSQQNLEGWDSVAQVKIVLTIESELGIRFATEEVTSARSVADLLAAIGRAVDAEP
jgi:acyl carrier protein